MDMGTPAGVGGMMPTPQKSSSNKLIMWGSILVALAAIAASFFVIQGVGANADYICTRIIETQSDCANGSWGPWTEVSTSNDTTACAITKIEKRVYTGTRTTQHILQYENLRTACEAGYAQADSGSGKSSSGFHTGTIISQSAACQIEETRTTRNPGTGPGCGGGGGGTGGTTSNQEITSTQSDITSLQDQATNVNSLNELTQFRTSMIAADIFARPALVQTGGTTVVKWTGREVTACTVTGTNGDEWEGTSGERTSGEINEATTYTLTCTAFNGDTVTDEATVNIVPVFQET